LAKAHISKAKIFEESSGEIKQEVTMKSIAVVSQNILM
jgi:hypothetical protein